MLPENAAKLVELIVGTWPSGPKGMVWTRVLTALDDASAAHQAWRNLARTEDKISVAKLYSEYNRLIAAADAAHCKPDTDNGPTMSLADYLDLQARKADEGDLEASTNLTEWAMDRIMRTTRADATTYDGASTYIAKLIIEAFITDPWLAQVPTENVYEKDADGRLVFNDEGDLHLVTPGLWSVLRSRLPAADLTAIEGMSGFMWGWAVNAARRCMGLPPVPNPAIIEIGGDAA